MKETGDKFLFSQEQNTVIAGNDVIAKGILYAAQANGLNVPGNISITGIGDFSSSESSFPSITTVRMRPNKVGVKAANVLLERINGAYEEIRSYIIL